MTVDSQQRERAKMLLANEHIGWPKTAGLLYEIAMDALDRVDALTRALEEADRLASVAHDAIWNESVHSTEILHSNTLADSAQSAIWKLHDVAREALAERGGG